MDLSDKPHFLNNAYHHHRQSLITLINFHVRPFHFLSQDPLHHTLVDKGAAPGILHIPFYIFKTLMKEKLFNFELKLKAQVHCNYIIVAPQFMIRIVQSLMLMLNIKA